MTIFNARVSYDVDMNNFDIVFVSNKYERWEKLSISNNGEITPAVIIHRISTYIKDVLGLYDKDILIMNPTYDDGMKKFHSNIVHVVGVALLDHNISTLSRSFHGLGNYINIGSTKVKIVIKNLFFQCSRRIIYTTYNESEYDNEDLKINCTVITDVYFDNSTVAEHRVIVIDDKDFTWKRTMNKKDIRLPVDKAVEVFGYLSVIYDLHDVVEIDTSHIDNVYARVVREKQNNVDREKIFMFRAFLCNLATEVCEYSSNVIYCDQVPEIAPFYDIEALEKARKEKRETEKAAELVNNDDYEIDQSSSPAQKLNQNHYEEMLKESEDDEYSEYILYIDAYPGTIHPNNTSDSNATENKEEESYPVTKDGTLLLLDDTAKKLGQDGIYNFTITKSLFGCKKICLYNNKNSHIATVNVPPWVDITSDVVLSKLGVIAIKKNDTEDDIINE